MEEHSNNMLRRRQTLPVGYKSIKQRKKYLRNLIWSAFDFVLQKLLGVGNLCIWQEDAICQGIFWGDGIIYADAKIHLLHIKYRQFMKDKTRGAGT